MKNIIVLQHIKIEDPGYIKDLMISDGINLTTIELDEGDKIPEDLDKFDAMFCMGGPMDTWMENEYPWLIEEKKKINNLQPTSKYKKNYFTYMIKNGRVYTDYVENVAYISDNFLINDASYQQIRGELKKSSFNVVLRKGTPRLIKKI